MMKSASGWVQGYNAQAAVNDRQVVVACAVTQDANDAGQYTPMVAAARAALAAVGIDEPIGMVLADAGYWSEANAAADGPDRLIATLKAGASPGCPGDWKQRRAAREMGTTSGPPPEGSSALEAMEHRLRTPERPRPTPSGPTPSSPSSPTPRRIEGGVGSAAGALAQRTASGR